MQQIAPLLSTQAFKAVWLLIGLLITGCASSQGFDRSAMVDALPANPTSFPDRRPTENQAPRLSPPFRLGVFFTNQDFPGRQSLRNVEWLTTDRERLLRELEPLQSEHILSNTQVLIDVTAHKGNTSGIRQAGSRHGADLVLIIDGVAAVDRYHNSYAWLYPTLIGAYFAPGTESAALVMVTGRLWAVHSDWQAPIQTVEGVSKLVGSAVLVEDTAALQQAKNQALKALAEQIADQLRQFK